MTLSEIIAALEKATGPSREIDQAIGFDVLGWRTVVHEAYTNWDSSWAETVDADGKPLKGNHAFTSSIEVAIALAERTLPGWGWDVASNTEHIKACLNPEFGKPIGKHPHWAAVSNSRSKTFEDAATPAMALVLATLKALQAKEPTP